MMAVSKTLVTDLEKLVPYGIDTNVPLAQISRWRIGGLADLIIRPESSEQVKAVRQYFYQRGIQHVVVGMTSNLLFADEGLQVPCIQIGNRMGKIEIENGKVSVQAGAWVPSLARKIQQAGLTGAEHICGIPGTIGGLICMNGGSQRKGIGISVIQVTSLDITGSERFRTADECCFSYRNSIFQRNGEIILNASLEFETAPDPRRIRKEMIEILSSRRKKFPQKSPNCGSVFKSDPELYEKYGTPGSIIESLGFKGFRVGGAVVPDIHANFILNVNNATASDVISIIKSIKSKSKEDLGISLTAEACYINQNGTIESL